MKNEPGLPENYSNRIGMMRERFAILAHQLLLPFCIFFFICGKFTFVESLLHAILHIYLIFNRFKFCFHLTVKEHIWD